MVYKAFDKMRKEKEATKALRPFRNRSFLCVINSVARSGMSRRIEFYAANKGEIKRIGSDIAAVAGYSYNIDKGGLLVKGCGMDMIFSVLSNFNYAMAQIDNPGKSLADLLKSKKCGERIYDTYFTDANRYRR